MKEIDGVIVVSGGQFTEDVFMRIDELLKDCPEVFLNTIDFPQWDFPFAEQKPEVMHYGPQRKGRGGKPRRW